MSIITFPFDEQAEVICLGSCISDDHALDLVLERLDDRHFHVTKHKIIFRYLKRFYVSGDKPKFADLMRLLSVDGMVEEAGGAEYIKNIETRARYAEIRYYITVLETVADKRDLLCLGRRLLESPINDVRSTVDEAVTILGSIGSTGKNPARPMSEVFSDYNDGMSYIEHFSSRWQDKKDGKPTLIGVPTGWPILDKTIHGLIKKELIILGARPSMGKSEFIIQMIYSMAKRGIKTMVFSLEMSAEQILNRIIGMCTKIQATRIHSLELTAEEASRIQNCAKMIQPILQNIIIDDVSNSSAYAIRARLKREIIANGVEVCLVDHLSKIAKLSPNAGQYQTITDNVALMKSIAQDCNIPLVLAAQLRRLNENEKVTLPEMHHLRDSGAVEQDADKILLVHRKDYYDKFDCPGQVMLLIRKNREGPRDVVYFNYDDRMQSLTEESGEVGETIKTIVSNTGEASEFFKR